MRQLRQLTFSALLVAPVLTFFTSGGANADQTEAGSDVVAAQRISPPVAMPNSSGFALTFSTHGFIDTNNPFFKPFGNGRACASCHQESQGWSVTPGGLQARFDASNGTDPIFQPVDGANSPTAPVATIDQKRVAYSMLLGKGLIRVGLPIPNNAEFDLIKVDDPYGFASAQELSLFRRPLPSTNLAFESTVMWDARETFTDANSKLCIARSNPPECFASRDFDLLHQANSAVLGHAQAAQSLTSAEQRAIVDFEKTLFTAQIVDNVAGSLNVAGATGGPEALAGNDFYFGINDFFAGDYKTQAPFNPAVMNIFAAWANPSGPGNPPQPGNFQAPPPPPAANFNTQLARNSIARGEAIFNFRPFRISGVAGFNDELGQPAVRGTCSSCHSSPNSGTQSVPRMFNTGVSAAELRTPDLPLYRLKNRVTLEVVETSDPGNALVTGKWKDIGRVKTPSLRAIESRSPYFHNGSATELSDVVGFYNRRFGIGFTPQEMADLTAFLKAL